MRLTVFAGSLLLLASFLVPTRAAIQPEALLRDAKAYQDVYNYPKALAIYEELLQKKFNPDLVNFEIGRCYLGLLQGDTALTYIEKIKGKERMREELDELRGRCYLSLGKYDEAVSAFQKALARAAKNPLLQFYVAHAARKAGRPDTALTLLDSLLTQQPAHALALLERGIVHQEKRRYQEAKQDLQAHLKAFPQNVEAHYRLARVLYTLGENEAAEHHMDLHRRHLVAESKRQISDLGIINESLRKSRVELLRRVGRLEEARALIEVYLPIDPDNPHLLFLLAVLQRALKQPDQSRATLRRLLSIESDSFLIPYYAGRYFYLQRNLVRAERYLTQAAESDPPFASLFDLLGLIASRNHQTERATNLLEKSIALGSTSLASYSTLAELTRRAGQPERAISLLETASGLYPREKSLYYALSRLYYEQDLPRKAEEVLQKARDVE